MQVLEGKVALVTGAARGIGKAVAQDLRDSGARVVVSDVNFGELDPSIGRPLTHDVTSESDWASVIASIAGNEGRLDILVNNAGVLLNKPFLDTSLDEFRGVHRVNVESIWMGMQAAAPLMSESATSRAGTSIINLSSIFGIVVGPMQAAYCASKAAVRQLTRATAVEFARNGSGIRVNSVHPGYVDTVMGVSAVDDAVANGRLPNLDAGKAIVASTVPLGRWAETAEIAGAVTFLASDASRYMTGAEVVVDGGATLL